MPELYTRYNEKTYDFVRDVLERLTREMSAMYPGGWEVWDKYRGIDGVTEYFAGDIIRYQVYLHLGMHGVSYEMYTDESPDTPELSQHLVWRYAGYIKSRTGVRNLDFKGALPHLLSDFWSVTDLIMPDQYRVTLTKNPDRANMFAMWIADVNGNVAYGNGPAEALLHAWGVTEGIWPPDTLPPAGTWRAAFTIHPDGNIS